MLTTADITIGDKIAPSDAHPSGGFYLLAPNADPLACFYVATFGLEGWGAKRHRVRYPCGAIGVQYDPSGRRALREFDGLDGARAFAVAFLNGHWPA